MTGQFGIHTGVVNHGGTNADIRLEGEERKFRGRLFRQTLPAFLRSQGFKTVSISPFAERHGAWHFNAGFNETHNTGKTGQEIADEIAPVALKWIKDNAKEDNWFLHVNFWDPHTIYRTPTDFGEPFPDEPIPQWPTEEVLKEHQQMVGPYKPNELHMYDDNIDEQEHPRFLGRIANMEDMKKMFDGYDTGIRYMDYHLGKLFAALEEIGVMDDLAIIISADHGEHMGELGIYCEHSTADESTSKIPMIIKWPEGKSGHFDDGLHYNLDLAPTIAELLHSDPVDSWDGESYAPAILEGKDCGRDQLILSQCAHVLQRSVRF